MPSRKVPGYCHHKVSGQARVRLDGKDHSLGVYGTKASRERYAELISDWFARQDHAPKAVDVARLAMLSLQYARKRYRKNGKPTSEVDGVRSALRFLLKDHRRLPASGITPRVLKAVREKMVVARWARTSV